MAIKIADFPEKENTSIIELANKEISILGKIRHPNLITYLGSFEYEDNKIAIVTEFCRGEDIMKLIIKKKFTVSQKVKILLDITSGMLYLHSLSPPIIHGYLKSLNILLTEELNIDNTVPNAKVADYGIGKLVEQSKAFVTTSGKFETAYWSAPEMLRGEKYSLMVDVYSFGVVMWELFSEKYPYKELNKMPSQIITQICSNNLRPEIKLLSNDTPIEIIQLIERCFLENPNNRPTFYEIDKILKNFLNK